MQRNVNAILLLYLDDSLVDVRICKENSNTEDIRYKE